MYKTLTSLYEMAIDKAPGLATSGQMSENRDKLTMYSLYKQIENGNAPNESEFKGNKDVKYNAWK